MLEQNDSNKMMLCLSCAAVFKKTTNTSSCPDCGREVDFDKFNKMLRSAKSAVYFGYMYPKAYEKQRREKGKVTTKYRLIDPDLLLQFIGIAAISGIIGGASYDIVKKIARKIISNYEVVNSKKEVTNNINDGYVDDVINYVEEYYERQKGFDGKYEGIGPEDFIDIWK